MKMKDIIKKQTTIIAIAVVVVTISAIGASYAIFFNVDKNSANQKITAGTLELSFSVNALNQSEVLSTADGLKTTAAAYTVKHTSESNLPATYSIYVCENSTNTIAASNLKYTTEGTSTAGSNAKNLTSITQETLNSKKCYKIDTGTINPGSTQATKYLRVWPDESIVTDEFENKALDLDLYIVSEVKE